MMNMDIDLRGSGVYSYDEDFTIECECGSLEGTRYTDDWKMVTYYCNDCGAEQDIDEDEPDYDGLYY